MFGNKSQKAIPSRFGRIWIATGRNPRFAFKFSKYSLSYILGIPGTSSIAKLKLGDLYHEFMKPSTDCISLKVKIRQHSVS